MKVIVSGSHGLIGTAVVARLREQGDHVTRLVRTAAGDNDVLWDPASGTIDAPALEGHDAVVHLAGVGIGDHRWTPAHKAAVRDSRVKGTELLATTIAGLSRRPSVLASASAVGFYGDRGDEELTEASGPGRGFLAEVVQAWEGATRPAQDAGIRVVRCRSGVVLSTAGGALARQLRPFKLGLGGRLGSGQQYLSWIAIDDEVAAIMRVLTNDAIAGPVNLVAPTPVTNREFTSTLGRVLHRPTIVPTPTSALRLLFGAEMVEEMLLAGQRVQPAVLRDRGFEFRHTELEPALRDLLAR